jgi:hypothetical protein
VTTPAEPRAFLARSDEYVLRLTRTDANLLLSLGRIGVAVIEGVVDKAERPRLQALMFGLSKDVLAHLDDFESLRAKMAALHDEACWCRDGEGCEHSPE